MTLGHLKENECPLSEEGVDLQGVASRDSSLFKCFVLLYQGWFMGPKAYSGSDGVWFLRLSPGHLRLVLLVHFVWRSQLLCCEETHNQPGGGPYHEEIRHLLPASTYQPAE